MEDFYLLFAQFWERMELFFLPFDQFWERMEDLFLLFDQHRVHSSVSVGVFLFRVMK